MKRLHIFTLFLLLYTEGGAQTPDLSKTYQDRANWFRQMPQFNWDSVGFYFDKAIQCLDTQKPTNYKRLTEVCLNKSEVYLPFDFNMVAETADKAWAYWEKMPPQERNDTLHYDLLFIKAIAGVFKGESYQALKNYETAYNLLYKKPDPAIQAKLLKNKGYFYIRYGVAEEKQNSFKAFQQSLVLYERLNNPNQNATAINRVLTHIADHFLQAGLFDSCMVYLQKTMDNNTRYAKSPYLTAWCDLEMADALISLKKDDVSAAQYIQRAVATLTHYNLINTSYFLEASSFLGDIKQRSGDKNAAIAYYKKALETASVIHSRRAEIDNLLKLSQVYQQIGDTKQALIYYQKHHDFTLDMAQKKSQSSIKEYELQLDLVSKEKEIQSGKLTRNFSMLGLGLLGLLAFVIYCSYRNQKKSNAILQVRNEEKEFLIKEIHHRVKNNLQILSSLLHLQSRNIKDDAALGAVREGQNRVKAMSLIHQKLYMGDNLAAVEMKDYMQNLADNLLDTFGIYDDRIKIVCDVPALSLDVDTAIPLGLVANELVTNSLKYAFPNPKNTEGGILTIALWINDSQQLCLKVADNGVGNLVLQPSEGWKPSEGFAADDYRKNSTRFGTNLIQTLSKKLQGRVEVLPVEKGYATLIQFDDYKVVSV